LTEDPIKNPYALPATLSAMLPWLAPCTTW